MEEDKENEIIGNLKTKGENSGFIEKIEKKEEEFVRDISGKIGDDEIIRIRKDKILNFLKKRWSWVTYVFLAIVVFLSVRIRTANLAGLKDITTGGWTLGPDLDPFLFLRWSEYIIEHGSLFATDTMRYIPLGYDTRGELLFHPYLMAWFHKVAVFFGSDSIAHSAVLYPVFMFALTVFAFFLLTKKIFIESMGEDKANVIALIACFFLSVIPALLPRTIAGIPEKESAAFLFLFLAQYFFLSAWKEKKFRKGIIFAILAGVSTAGMALIWGGYGFIFLTIGPAVFISFLLGKAEKKHIYIYGAWLISSFALMIPFSTRYTIKNLATALFTGSSIVVLFIMIFHFYIFIPYLKKYFSSGKLSKIPSRIMSIIIASLSVIILLSVLSGPRFIIDAVNNIRINLISPGTSRIFQTVAENRQPFFNEWSGSFGPYLGSVPIFFWLFFIGSIYLFYKMIYVFKKKERVVMSASFTLFLFAVVFSRYASDSTFNGTNFASLFLYAAGFIVFLICLGYYYYQYYRKNEESRLENIDIGYILIFIFFFLSIVSARGTVRLIMLLVPSTSIIVAYFIVSGFKDSLKIKEVGARTTAWVLLGVIVIGAAFAGLQFYESINSEARGYAPSIYTQQWQKAMSWVRDNVREDAVFGHWWDYGYWVQSIGKRATVLDGGNAIGNWNRMMGRYGLTGTDNRVALEYLYAHDTTHFLIDSSDIGKYTAFSSIGSDINYDRISWMPVFLKDNSQIQETKNATIYLYTGGSSLDEDIIYEQNGTRIFLPGGKAGIGAFLIEKSSDDKLVNQPSGVYVYQNQQYKIPLRYAFSNGEFKDFGSGIEAGVFIFPSVSQTNFENDGAIIYLTKRTVKSQLARLYLYNEDNPNFKLVHSEDDFVVAELKKQDPNIGDIIYFNGVRGPIRIWEINYPSDIELKEEYLSTLYPEELILAR